MREKLVEKQRLTTSFVVSEAYTWLRYHVGFELASQFLRATRQSESAGLLEIVRPRPFLEAQAEELLRKFSDHPLSYADAFGFAVIEDREIAEVFTFDKHFRLTGRRIVPE